MFARSIWSSLEKPDIVPVKYAACSSVSRPAASAAKGHVGRGCGAESKGPSAADHRMSGAGDRAVDRDVAAMGPHQSGIRDIAFDDEPPAAGSLGRPAIGHDMAKSTP